MPFRQIFEALGAGVWYDEATHPAMGQKVGLTIQLPIEQAKALVNGKEVGLDVTSQVVNGRTMMPLRFISENLSCTVTPEGDNLGVNINRIAYTTPSTQQASDSSRLVLDGVPDYIRVRMPKGELRIDDSESKCDYNLE